MVGGSVEAVSTVVMIRWAARADRQPWDTRRRNETPLTGLTKMKSGRQSARRCGVPCERETEG